VPPLGAASHARGLLSRINKVGGHGNNCRRMTDWISGYGSGMVGRVP
jgi:hypothetical protein